MIFDRARRFFEEYQENMRSGQERIDAGLDAVFDGKEYDHTIPDDNKDRRGNLQRMGHNIPDGHISRDQYTGIRNGTLIIDENGNIVEK